MRICIYGAGAIGGYLGVQLSLAGEDVTLVARGPHLAAMKEHGLKLLIDGEERVARPHCTDDPAEAGPQDYVIVTLKAHSVPAVVDLLHPLLGPDTAVVTAANGVPWWYFYGLEGPWRDRRLESVDPGGAQWRKIGPRAGDRLCGVPGHRGGRAGRGPTHGRESLHLGGAERRKDRACPGVEPGPRLCGVSGAHPKHP